MTNDKCALSRHLFIAGLQLLVWLFLRPGAWRAHLAKIDPDLPPDFALLGVRAEQWHNPELRRLLIAGLGILPLWSGIFAGAVLGMMPVAASPVLGIACGIALSLTAGLTAAFTIAVPIALAASTAAGTLLGISVGMAGDLSNNLLNAGAGVLALGAAGSVNSTLIHEAGHSSLSRQLGSIILGGLVSVLMLLITGSFAGFVFKHILALLVSILAFEATLAFELAYAGIIGIVLGVFLGMILGGYTHRWYKSLAFGLIASLISSGLITLLLHVTGSEPLVTLTMLVAIGIGTALLFALPYLLAGYIATQWAGVIAGVLVCASAYVGLTWFTLDAPILWTVLPAIIFGLTRGWWQSLLLYPFMAVWSLLLYRAEQRRVHAAGSLFRKHSVCWDESQYFPLYSLESYLLVISERYPEEGHTAIAYVSTTRQRWAAQAAQIELDARCLQNCDGVDAISEMHRHLAAGELSGPVSSLLRSLSRVSRDAAAALAQTSPYNQRLALQAVEEHLEGLLRELTRSSEPYAVRFRAIVDHWRHLIAAGISNYAIEDEGEIDNPYTIGLPLTAQQAIFVGRKDISLRIERFLHKNPCPPLLLYGQRRMGKTSLLNNLSRLLPGTVIPLLVDMQGPVSLAENTAGFLYGLSRDMLHSARLQCSCAWPVLDRESLESDPFTGFTEWLDKLENTLTDDTVLLLALDEFAALDQAFQEKRLGESMILGFFRHLIQHRPRLKFMLSGSHTLDEFKRWASYLINVQTIPIGYLQEAEARHLIERPIANFGLVYTPEACRRVLQLTHCHPYLVQLLCSEIVTLKNEHPMEVRRMAQAADVEAAVPYALESGNFFFADIERNQIIPSAQAILHGLASQGEGAIAAPELLAKYAPETPEAGIKNLLRHELIETVNGGYRFQVELIRRWFLTSNRA
ncbi:MAG: MFS transporter [Gammaproteobacteria bacterium]|nr:MFS transporter [Gammaproteobacteria bacterium]